MDPIVCFMRSLRKLLPHVSVEGLQLWGVSYRGGEYVIRLWIDGDQGYARFARGEDSDRAAGRFLDRMENLIGASS